MKWPIVECKHCGWQHFAVTRAYAEDEVKRFNEYYDTLTALEQMAFYGGRKSSIRKYEHCNLCNRAPDMVEPTINRDGCTLGPIIWEIE